MLGAELAIENARHNHDSEFGHSINRCPAIFAKGRPQVEAGLAVAKFEPVVSHGRQKNFAALTIELAGYGNVLVIRERDRHNSLHWCGAVEARVHAQIHQGLD